MRFDTHLYPGYTVPPFYDSLLGKLIVWGESREDVLARLRDALAELKIEGIPTTTSLHTTLVDDPEVAAGRFHLAGSRFGWIDERHLAKRLREQ